MSAAYGLRAARAGTLRRSQTCSPVRRSSQTLRAPDCFIGLGLNATSSGNGAKRWQPQRTGDYDWKIAVLALKNELADLEPKHASQVVSYTPL
jgi:hypothetical protein